MACGTGVVGKELRQAGYENIDGLDPSQGYLQEAEAQGIFRKVFRAFIDPEKPTEIPDDTYDALLCCAGFFQVNQNSRASSIFCITLPLFSWLAGWLAAINKMLNKN